MQFIKKTVIIYHSVNIFLFLISIYLFSKDVPYRIAPLFFIGFTAVFLGIEYLKYKSLKLLSTGTYKPIFVIFFCLIVLFSFSSNYSAITRINNEEVATYEKELKDVFIFQNSSLNEFKASNKPYQLPTTKLFFFFLFMELTIILVYYFNEKNLNENN